MLLPTTILVPIDFSSWSEQAFEYACSLAAKLGASMYLLSVVDIPIYGAPELAAAMTPSQVETAAEQNEAALMKLAARHEGDVRIVDTVLRTGDPRTEIVDTAIDVKADLIVMGTHGRRGLKRALLGSVAENVVRTAPCPVLLVRSEIDIEHHARTDLEHDEVVARHH